MLYVVHYTTFRDICQVYLKTSSINIRQDYVKN